MSVITIPAGMKVWAGGDKAPEDWDPTGPMLFRDGSDCSGVEGDPFWDHGWGDRDIVAYTPKRDGVSDRELLLDILRVALSQEKTGSKQRSAILVDTSATILAFLSKPEPAAAKDSNFLKAIHERTPTGAWIAVQHHPDGDWSVAERPLPWLPGREVATPTSETDQLGGVGVGVGKP